MRNDPLTNFADRHNFLRLAVLGGEQDLLATDSFQTEEIVNRTIDLYGKYDRGFTKLRVAKTDKAEQVELQKEASGGLGQGLSHFYTCVTQRNQRDNVPKSSLQMYGMPDQPISSIRSAKVLIQLAGICIEGDALSVERGLDPMVNPSPAELQKLLDTSITVERKLNAADQSLTVAQKTLDGFRLPLDDLRKEMQIQFNKTTRGDTNSRRRRIMRRFGFSFKTVEEGSEESELEVPEKEEENLETKATESEQDSVTVDDEIETETPTGETPEPAAETEAPT